MLQSSVRAPRPPAVAGRFYPDETSRLAEVVRRQMQGAPPPERAIAAVGPHAGYVYCGALLGQTYARIQVPSRVILLCPNHTGRGVARSLWSGGAWQLPGGSVPIDEELARLCQVHAGLQPDQEAHAGEHAIEVHLPFLRAANPEAHIVPIVLAGLDVSACRQLGEGLAEAVSRVADDVLVVASTDMSHFLTADAAEAKDRLALACIEAMDPEALHHTVRAHAITMCGYVPTTCALFAAKALGASKSELVGYTHSGHASGDRTRVVGYAGASIT
jgi:MEMO1 family protein